MRRSKRPQPAPQARFGHAVVIGAGIAGLLAARALSDTFDRVTLVERDRLDPAPLPRKGVPQGKHAHALQARGLRILEAFFPGISHELRTAGASPVDFCRQARLHLPTGAPAPLDSGILIQPVSRPLLEATIRHRVLGLAGVRLCDGHTVTGLRTDSTGRRVIGALLVGGTGRRSRSTTVELADLVIDASGRTSHLPDWLTAIGLPRVHETTLDPRVGYATRTYHTDAEAPAGWLALFEPPHAPNQTRGCFALRIENHLLQVTLQGASGDHPPTDPPGFTEFIKSLGSDLAATVAPLRPASTAVRYARTANCRRHYHRLAPWPDGLISLGDAVCVFNPIYAQGMAVAALEARAMADMLSDHQHLRGFARAFQRRTGRITNWPWTMATLADHGWQPDQPASWFVQIGQWYLDRWYAQIPYQPRMFHDFARVANMLSGPSTLLRPAHLAHILTHPPAHKEEK